MSSTSQSDAGDETGYPRHARGGPSADLAFGVFVPQGWRMDLTNIGDPLAQYAAMTRVAQLADSEPAIDSIWLYDHLQTVPEPTHESTFECWTTTAALARET